MKDLIDRQEALDALNEQIEQCDKALSSFDISMKDRYAVKVERASLMAYKETLEYMPSAQPTCKNGKWIQFPTHMAYKCSECGRIIQTTDGRRNVSRHYPFCHCGADMRGADNAD